MNEGPSLEPSRAELVDFRPRTTGRYFSTRSAELPVELQPKLLRVIQEQEVERLGSSQPLRVDVRIVAATNQDLEQMLADRTFRLDLFYRLHVFPITIPPLRDRPDDIPLLIDHFLSESARRHGRATPSVPREVVAALVGYAWPGNIRQLQNFIERSVIVSTGRELRAPIGELTNANGPTPHARTLADADRAHIVSALRKTKWVVGGQSGAAARLGLNRTTLISKMRKLGHLAGALAELA